MTSRRSSRWFVGAVAASLVTAMLAGCAAPQPNLSLNLSLDTGEQIDGRGFDRGVVLVTELGEERVPLSQVRAVDASGDGETVRVRLVDGLERRGVLGGSVLEVHRPGASPAQPYELASIRSLRVTPRLRLDGSDDAYAWWDPTFEAASGFEVANVGGRIRVTGIDAEVVNHESHGTWGIARLTQRLRRPLDDFDLGATLSWDDEGAGERAMQRLVISVLGADGSEIAAVGHHDVWSGETGSRFSSLAGVPEESGYNSTSTSGRCGVRIVREDGQLEVRWKGRTIRTGTSREPAARVVLSFEFYPYEQGGVTSEFGSLTIEKLSIH